MSTSTLLPRKPLASLTDEEQEALLSGAKAGPEKPSKPETKVQQQETTTDKSKNNTENETKTGKSLNIDNLVAKKNKKLPLDIPPELHVMAKKCAAKAGKPLYEYILIALAEKVMRDNEKSTHTK